MHSTTSQRWMDMFECLMKHFGPQHWWPGETQLEMMVGAVLTQNTNWQNVERAIERLKDGEWLSLERLHLIPVTDLAEKIRPTGYFNVKAKRLKNLIDFIWEQYGGDLSRIMEVETDELREGLLSVNGVGPETADSILLYAFHRAVFVVDTYTYRILNRHGMADDQAGYDDLQALFMEHLPDDPGLFNEFHALIVRVGKEYCRKKPRCQTCPLEPWGPVSPVR